MTDDIISCRPGIVGRSSFVCGANFDMLNTELALKFSYQDVSHTNEYELIQHAKSCEVDHIPMVYALQDLKCLSVEGLFPKQIRGRAAHVHGLCPPCDGFQVIHAGVQARWTSSCFPNCHAA